MIISLIVAMDENRGIGKNNRLPWHLPADFQLFKKHTFGHHIILGRKTYESLGKPLSGRPHIILTHDFSLVVPEMCYKASNLVEAFKLAREKGETETFIIGGEQVYNQSLIFAERLYITTVHHEFDVDAYFPPLRMGEWETVESFNHPSDDKNAYAFTFVLLKRRSQH
jgi:dihydrofolate reductase